ALRLRLRVCDPDRDHRADHDRRGIADPGQTRVQAMSAIHPATTREWHRFTPPERIARYAIYFAIVAAVAVSAESIEVIPEFLADAPEQFADMFQRMWPVA